MGDEGISGSAVKLAKNSELYSTVARDKNAIAFAPVDLALSPKVRFVGIKASSSGAAIAPTMENIREHRYLLVRPLYFIFSSEPAGELQRFAEWVLSAQGRLVVEAAEFWPLSSLDRDKGKSLIAAR